MGTIILVGVQRPFEKNTKNVTIVLEEATIIVIMYHIFCFTDWLPNLEVRHNLGYSVISCIMIHLFVFLIVTFATKIRSYIRKLRRKKYIKEARKQAAKDRLTIKPGMKRFAKSLKSRQAWWRQEIRDENDFSYEDSDGPVQKLPPVQRVVRSENAADESIVQQSTNPMNIQLNKPSLSPPATPKFNSYSVYKDVKADDI